MIFLKKNKQSGFGLVEVIVSLAIMAMVILSLHYLGRSAFYSWENAQNKSIAYNLIQQKIEDLRYSRDLNILEGNPFDSGIIDSEEPIESDPEAGGPKKSFIRKTTVEDVPIDLLNSWGETVATTKKKVTVTITWQERMGERSISSSTYLTEWKSSY